MKKFLLTALLIGAGVYVATRLYRKFNPPREIDKHLAGVAAGQRLDKISATAREVVRWFARPQSEELPTSSPGWDWYNTADPSYESDVTALADTGDTGSWGDFAEEAS